MNQNEILNLVSQAILDCTDRQVFRYALYFRNGGIQCGPALKMPKDCPFIGTVTRQQLEHGMIAVKWQELGDQAFKIWKELKT